MNASGEAALDWYHLPLPPPPPKKNTLYRSIEYAILCCVLAASHKNAGLCDALLDLTCFTGSKKLGMFVLVAAGDVAYMWQVGYYQKYCSCTPQHIFLYSRRELKMHCSPPFRTFNTMLVFSVYSQSKVLGRLGGSLAGKVTAELESKLCRGQPHGEADRLFFLGEETSHLNGCTCVCLHLIVSFPSCCVRVCGEAGEALLFITSQPSTIPSTLFLPPNPFFVGHLFMESSW